MTTKPHIILTMGSPRGIGPEIAVSVYNKVRDFCDLTIIGNENVLREAATLKGLHYESIATHVISQPYSGDRNNLAETGHFSFEILKTATEMVKEKKYDALVTCPINKSEWQMADVPYTGHTEYLATATETTSYAMMMASPRLKVTLATIHEAIRDIPSKLTAEKIITATGLTYRALRNDFDISYPHIAIAALNPHCGDGGLFGDEEEKVIKPAIQALKERDVPVFGPFPGDTIFDTAATGEFDAVIAMYHDQGLAAVKTFDMMGTVNVTLGLPIIRTSVDHGTAEDIAWKGLADPTNLVNAITMAVEIFILKSPDFRRNDELN